MKMTVLVDNNGGCGLTGEWGLSVYIEYGDCRILLDTGASELFAANAARLGIDLKGVDFGVLSHAHYDHGNGLDTFFEINDRAPFYLSPEVSENCYSRSDNRSDSPSDSDDASGFKYDGIKKGLLEKYRDRIAFAGEICHEIRDGVYLLRHTTPGLEEKGKAVGQYIRVGDSFKPDNFSHEQSLVIRTHGGLVVFNSCCHGGVDNIIKEVRDAFPDHAITAIVGGFHMFLFDEAEVRAQAERIRACGLRYIVTGHCTGENQFRWLKNALSDDPGITVRQLACGLQIEF